MAKPTKRDASPLRSGRRVAGERPRRKSGQQRHVRPTAAKRAPAKKRGAGQAHGVGTRRATSARRAASPSTTQAGRDKAKRPAIAVGAAAAGVAGGLVLRSRTRRKTVLGVPVPRSLGKTSRGSTRRPSPRRSASASKQFAKTTKNVSKDLERAGDQAERIGKILD